MDYTDSKSDLLKFLREEADKIYVEIKGSKDHKKKADKLNKKMNKLKKELISGVNGQVELSKNEILERILLVDYCANIVMLEYRNKVWPYEYMAFSRRIGEIWEPFCKLPFAYPVNSLKQYKPPKFENVKNGMKKAINDLIEEIAVPIDEKKKLINYYEAVWQLVESGGIKLGLDLHFKKEDSYYNVDYKSGFSSNEKGNTNRLLLVASIYSSLPEKHNMLIFVRQKEEENNHYLQTLKNSPYWDVYCADQAYAKINEFSGFDLKEWMDNNMKWEQDISLEFHMYLKKNHLLKYLTW